MAQQLLTAFGGGIAAPSANRYGHLSPTRAEHVREELGEHVRVLLDGGECPIGIESTIISFEGSEVRLLRPGSITAAQVRNVVGELLIGADRTSPRVPGSSAMHYAPSTPMTIVPSGEICVPGAKSTTANFPLTPPATEIVPSGAMSTRPAGRIMGRLFAPSTASF